MTMDTATSPIALRASAITAVYLALASLALFFGVGFPWALPLMPGLLLLLAPAPLLKPLGLAEHNWLVGTWPTEAGLILLIALYTALAWALGAWVAQLRAQLHVEP